MERDDEPKAIGRRHALGLFGMGVATGGFVMLGGCGSKSGGDTSSKGSSAGSGCNTPLDEQSKTTRRTLQYSDKANPPEKNCASCAQFEAKKYDECGGCKVITGPVKPEGGCLAFAPLTGAAPSSSKG